MNAVGLNNTDTDIPIGERRCREDPINEYSTKQLMQCCFPTLFPDGCSVYHAIDGHEPKLHDYTLSELCAHLMKWHDRRYIIHGNFKFFA
ncbi:hypothetical protein JG688_00014107 [Phytophthora aleatoria]|uniref:Uncharacterized protein n=1 Tax=Phytophthora aleatoria TaxID=2496075 RepID=A0A8J5I7X0_9STRA|nr:hypothetical protein JG688_00014107 [Phytophthora aleatoria]